jgi:hypothetical protein
VKKSELILYCFPYIQSNKNPLSFKRGNKLRGKRKKEHFPHNIFETASIFDGSMPLSVVALSMGKKRLDNSVENRERTFERKKETNRGTPQTP